MSIGRGSFFNFVQGYFQTWIFYEAYGGSVVQNDGLHRALTAVNATQKNGGSALEVHLGLEYIFLLHA